MLTVTHDQLKRRAVEGRLAPVEQIYDFGRGTWTSAASHPALRRSFIQHATSVGVLQRIVWMSASGGAWETGSLDGARAAARDGFLDGNTAIRIEWAGWSMLARADEIVGDRGWLQRWAPLLAVGAAAIGGVMLYQHVVNSRQVDPRDPYARRDICRRDGYRCGLCGSKLTCKHAHIDHKLPRSRGGQDTWGNLHATHARCNLRKGALTIQEFKSLFA